jgi:hypothetical protein
MADQWIRLTHSKLNDLIRELQLTKEKNESFGSRLREKNMLAFGVKFSWYRNREKEFRKYYAQEYQLVFVGIFVIFCINWERKNMILASGAFLSTLPNEVLRPFYFITATY